MNVGYSERARRDLESIATYLTPRNPKAAERVGAAIERSIRRLAAYPFSGRKQDEPGDIRKLVVPGFGYLVYYAIESGTDLKVLTIRHPAQRREFRDR